MKRLLARLLVVLALVIPGAAIASSGVAGAGVNRYPCQGGTNGWFSAINGSVNCAYAVHNDGVRTTGYQVTVDMHKGSLINRGVVDMWIPTYVWESIGGFNGNVKFYTDGTGAFVIRVMDPCSNTCGFTTPGWRGLYWYDGGNHWYQQAMSPGHVGLGRVNNKSFNSYWYPTQDGENGFMTANRYGVQGGYAMDTSIQQTAHIYKSYPPSPSSYEGSHVRVWQN